MSRDNSGSTPVVSGPGAFSTGGSTGFEPGYRVILGGSYGDYDIEFIGSHIDNWDYSSAGTLADALAFDDPAGSPVVFPGPVNTLGFTNSLFTAASTPIDEDVESELLRAGATYFVNGSSRFRDYQINIGTNPNRYPWRFSVGWRQMRLSENNAFGITGTFDALDSDDGAVAGAPGGDPNDGLSHGALDGAGYTLRSGAADGYDGFNALAVGVSPDTLQLYYDSTAENLLNGVQVSGGYQLLPESIFALEVFGRFGLYHNHITSTVGEYLIGSVNDDSVYQRTHSGVSNGVAAGGALGFKASVPVTDYISFTAGYEALYIANVALASAQFGGLYDTPLGDRGYSVQQRDKLIMHGVTLGAQVVW